MALNIDVSVESLKKTMMEAKPVKPPAQQMPHPNHSNIPNGNSRLRPVPLSAGRNQQNPKSSDLNKTNPFHVDDQKHSEKEESKLNAPSAKEIASTQRQNQQKAKAIQQSLMERQRKLQKEQNDLKLLNSEFANMEQQLSKDVERLRGIIEGINRDISWYQSDFEWKKKQYLQSKERMDKLKERRDDLTKHLHTIIANNEEIKAKKMQELMVRLQAMQTVSGDETQQTPIAPQDQFGGFDGNLLNDDSE